MNEIKYSHDVSLFRAAISEEKSVTLDFSYLAGTIESWWKKNHDQDMHNLKTQLVTLLLTYLRSDDIFYFDKVGLANGYAVVCIKNIFSLDSPKLALTVHEALATCFTLPI